VPSSNDLPPTAVLQPPAAPLLDPPTLLKLVLGGTVLLLLLFSFLPTPRDPVAQNFADRLLLPQGASGTHMLGTDALGRDTLSRLMAGGRFLVERLASLAGVLTVAGLLLRRRLRKRDGGAWLTGRRLMLGIVAVLALSVLLEFALVFINGGPLERLGVFGRVVFGAERIPPLPSWGGMLAEGREQMGRAPWLAVFPGAGLLVVAAGIVAFASGLADVWRRRQRRPANEPSLAAE